MAHSLAGLAAPWALAPAARAADATWPTRPVRLVVPYAPGGSSEVVARAVAADMSEKLGQSMFVDNKPGAGGNVAMQEVARSNDGNTVVLGHVGTMAVNPEMYSKLSYDVNKDFVPISLLAKVPAVYIVNPSVPARNLTEMLALARKSPGRLNYGSAGNGSGGHLAFEYLKMVSNAFIVHVPYKGTGSMLTDLMGERLEAACVGISGVLSLMKAGKLRAIAVSSAQRLPQLPDVPTVAEQGFPSFEFTQWYGLLAPAKWQAAQVKTLESAAMRSVRSPNVLAKLANELAIPVGNTSEEFRGFIKAEQARWKPVIQHAQIKAD